MASEPIEFDAVPGLSLTVNLYPLSAPDTATAGSPYTATERTNDAGSYTITAAGLTGDHKLQIKSGSTTIGKSLVTLTNTTALKFAQDILISDITTDLSGVEDDLAIVLAKLSGGRFTVVSPVTENNEVEIVQGDDYLTADGRSLSWTIEDYAGPDAEDLTIALQLTRTSDYEDGTGPVALETEGSAAMAGDDLVLTVELTAEQTAALNTSPPESPFNYTYQLLATTDDDSTITYVLAAMTVKRRA